MVWILVAAALLAGILIWFIVPYSPVKAEFAELTIVAHSQDEVAIGTGEILIRHDIRMGVTQALG